MADGETSQPGALAVAVQSTRLLLAVQLIVALLAFVAAATAGFQVFRLEQQRASVVKQIVMTKQELAAAVHQKDVAQKDAETYAVALGHFQAGLGAISKKEPDAIGYFVAASAAAPNEPLFIRALADMQLRSANPSDVGDAPSTVERLEDLASANIITLSVDDYALIARGHCKGKDLDGAEAILKKAPASALQAISASKELRPALLADCANPRIYALFNAAPATAAAAFKVTKVFIHIASNDDRPAAAALETQLQAAGYVVPGIELVATNYPRAGQLRYYYEVQKPQAEDVNKTVTGFLRTTDQAAWRGTALTLRSIEGLYDGLPQDRVEIWLPPRAS